ILVRKKEYVIEYGRTDLKNVAKITRSMPENFMNKDRNYPTELFVKYAKPIVGPLPETGKLKFYPIKK
ncbi:MAG: 6-phosphofructokinase, partial [bacterium]|nr:6-phosphofructokinase [bacterium]